MTLSHWPLSGLRLRTPLLELRLPTLADLDELAGLAAEFAISSAFTGNTASLGVSRTLGYLPDGIQRQVIRGRPAVLQRLRLDRAAWQARPGVPVEITGLAPCLPGFGLPPA